MFEQWDWNTTLWGIPLTNLLLAAFIFLVVLLFRTLFARIVLKQIRNFVSQTESTLDDKIFTALEAPFKLIFIVLGFYVAITVLDLSLEMDAIITPFIRSIIIFKGNAVGCCNFFKCWNEFPKGFTTDDDNDILFRS